MPCKYAIAQEGKVVIERWTGTVSRQELMAHKKQQALDPSIKENASVLSDCTSAVFALSPDDIGRISAMDTGPDKDPKITRYAFLVNDDTYESARQFSDQVNKGGKSVIIFTSLEVASLWLGLDASTVRERIAGADG